MSLLKFTMISLELIMNKVSSDQELDLIVWSLIQGSSNALDFLDYLRHTLNRPGQQEEAFQAAAKFWANKNEPRHFYKAVAALEEMAEEGNDIAMFHLGRWNRLGYGVSIDTDKGLAWYRKGAEAGSARCLINVARCTAKYDVPAAIELFRKAAVEMSDLSAHCFWADFDKENYDEHMQLAASSGDPFSMYSLAYQRLKKMNDADAAEPWLDMLKSAAQKGESYACTQLGQIYRDGHHGIAKDHEVSLYWLNKAMALGNEAACAILGRDLLARDEDLGINYLKRAAMLNDAFAQSILGQHQAWYGKCRDDQLDGVVWLRASAQQGHKYAINKLAEALQSGRGPEVEKNEALIWLQKGASLGMADCQSSLGIAYIKGEIMDRDEEKAHNLFHLASLQGDSWGTYLLALTYENGHGTAKDLVQAFKCFKMSAEKGELKAAHKLGLAYLWAVGVEEDVPAAATWLKTAASAGHADSQAYLGMLFSYGHGVEENAEIALYWLELSAKQESAIGLRELARLYEAGEGVDADIAEATRLMAKAASLGDEKAKAWIDKKYPNKPDWLKGLGNLSDKNFSDDE
jgi:TPR repeat protein